MTTTPPVDALSRSAGFKAVLSDPKAERELLRFPWIVRMEDPSGISVAYSISTSGSTLAIRKGQTIGLVAPPSANTLSDVLRHVVNFRKRLTLGVPLASLLEFVGPYEVPARCSACADKESVESVCPECQGLGEVECECDCGDEHLKECPLCDGVKHIVARCGHCDGCGFLKLAVRTGVILDFAYNLRFIRAALECVEPLEGSVVMGVCRDMGNGLLVAGEDFMVIVMELRVPREGLPVFDPQAGLVHQS